MAKKKTKTSTSNGKSTTASFDAAVSRLVTTLQGALTQLAALGLPQLTAEERATANGKLRVGEEVALEAILDTMDAYPGVFQALAAKDGGTDPTAVETAPARTALAQGESLQPLAAIVDRLARAVSDGVLSSFTTVKEVTVLGYGIGKASAASDAAVRKVLAPALNFYGGPARKRATEEKTKATKARKAAKPPQPQP